MLKQRQRTCRRVSKKKKTDSKHTISRMPGIRHRKSLYCRHREQLWGDKRGIRHYSCDWAPHELLVLLKTTSFFNLPTIKLFPHKIFYNKKVKVSVGPDVTLECGDWENIKTTDGHIKLSSIPCATTSFWMQHDMAVFRVVFQMS